MHGRHISMLRKNDRYVRGTGIQFVAPYNGPRDKEKRYHVDKGNVSGHLFVPTTR